MPSESDVLAGGLMPPFTLTMASIEVFGPIKNLAELVQDMSTFLLSHIRASCASA